MEVLRIQVPQMPLEILRQFLRLKEIKVELVHHPAILRLVAVAAAVRLVQVVTPAVSRLLPQFVETVVMELHLLLVEAA